MCHARGVHSGAGLGFKGMLGGIRRGYDVHGGSEELHR